jgi:AcrR family transcriptional regulator
MSRPGDEQARTVSRRSPRSSAEVRHLVVQAATALFAERGYARVATRDIARFADVTPSQLFAHFGTKARLFEIAIVDPYVATVSSFAERWRNDPASSPRLLYTVILKELFDVVGAEPGLMTALIIAQAHEESLVAEIEPSLRPVDEALRPLEQLVQVPGSADPNAPVIAIRLTHGTVLAATQFQPWLTSHLTDRESTIAAMTDLLTNGLGSTVDGATAARGLLADNTDKTDGADRTNGADRAPAEGMRPRLLDAAATLFQQRGYPGVSTRSIATEAGTSETILFRHFPTKTALFEQAVIEPWSGEVTRFLDHTREHDLTPLLAEMYHLFHRNRPALVSLLEYERHSTEPTETPASFTALLDHLQRRLPPERAHASSIAGLTVAAVLGAAVLDVWLFTGHAPGSELVVAGLVDLMESGISVR